jgi:leader peptidase (prepilin peptidase)/N-methyltransferase
MLLSIFPTLFLILFLYVITLADLCDQRIPDFAILAAILVKAGHAVFAWCLNEENQALSVLLLQLFIDGIAVSLPVLLLILLIEKIWQKEALGGGDIKLIFVTGMYLGWEKNLWMLLIACMMGAVVGIVRAREKVTKEEAYFPFGPMIALATVFCMLL